MSVKTANLGFPRIGPKRELKKATEAYWSGSLDAAGLDHAARSIRIANWRLQREAGIDIVPSNDFSLYDQVLDTIALVGAVPERFGWTGDRVDIDTYFAMARGREGVPAMEMSKWFDTNYHYIVPELDADPRFRRGSDKPIAEYVEARDAGIATRPVLLGPVSFLLLGKVKGAAAFDALDLLDDLLPVYEGVLRDLAAAGADWVQIDEPCLVLDLKDRQQAAFASAYRWLRDAETGVRLMLATYFEGLHGNLPIALGLPVDGLHLDLVRAPDQLRPVLHALPSERILSLGIVDGRNVWRADLDRALGVVGEAVSVLGTHRVQVAPSCSLLHSPVDLDLETGIDAELRGWLAFAKQKLSELRLIADAAAGSADAVAFEETRKALASRRRSERVRDPAVRNRVAAIGETMLRRAPFRERMSAQRAAFDLPPYPTTTIGSFPQTPEVRRMRARHRRGEIDDRAYETFLKAEIEKAIRWQEEIGLDVLVHGEFERTDMVEYFADQLAGFLVTSHGWVQSYGSRCIKPPVIYGDVSRPRPMTVAWSAYAASLTDKIVKGMLTGPVTMLQWSFARDDLPRSAIATQIALAIRDEVTDLERAGIGMIQIDEPAFREGLPLRAADRAAYLDWAVAAFRLGSVGVSDATQIHTHMCYSEFNEIMQPIADLDADVISIETSRSNMDLLDAFVSFDYPNQIGPGVYDIHSPRTPTREEMVALLRRASDVLDAGQIWVNPDCGLKTRRWREVESALVNMVEAARTLRSPSG